MPVQSTNPEYDAHLLEWQMMDDALEGECAITRNEKYLPKPSGMVEAEKLDAVGNTYLYRNYRDRAQYEHWVRDSLRSIMGLVFRLIPEISLPSGLKDLEDNATADGFDLKQLFLRMVRQTVPHGRVPLVVKVDDSRTSRPTPLATPSTGISPTKAAARTWCWPCSRSSGARRRTGTAMNASRSTASSTWRTTSATPRCGTRLAS